MKAMVALLLVATLCFCLCACHIEIQSGGTSGNQQNNADKPLNEKLVGNWVCTNFKWDSGLDFLANGKTSVSWVTWSVSGDVISITETSEDQTITTQYQLHTVHGRYLMIGENKTYVLVEANNPITYTEVQLTEENWQEYFEYGSDTSIIKDQFGDETGQVTHYYVRLKTQYYQRLLYSDSDILVRYQHLDGLGNEQTFDKTCSSERAADSYFYGWFLESDGAQTPIQMLRIEGKLVLMNLE